ncbi:hypothetical protein, partial [Methanoculleus sp. UBA291]|uniref:hypothetical protein n=1 Tax=Methanoculleus sp. UBA291 TaxID=1915495 RepID=UPI00316AD162
ERSSSKGVPLPAEVFRDHLVFNKFIRTHTALCRSEYILPEKDEAALRRVGQRKEGVTIPYF